MQLNNDYFSSWLHRRGITDEILSLFSVTTYDHPTIGECIKIPFSPTHSKYRRDPRHDVKPKYLYDAGGTVTLYGADHLTAAHTHVVITEGELDALVLWSMNIPAVSSTGGAMSFKAEWADTLKDIKDIYLCFDNDGAGAEGMVRVLKHLPHARVIFIPEQPGVKDISDFVGRGGDFRALMQSAKVYPTLAAVLEDMEIRKGQWLPVRFHECFVDANQPKTLPTTNPSPYTGSDEVLRAKNYPLTNLMTFTQFKACCPFHNEKTASFHYYAKTNSAHCFGCGKTADAIDVYRAIHHCSFKSAVSDLNALQ